MATTPPKATVADADVAEASAEPAAATPEARKFDPRVMVYVYDAETGAKLPNPVPETWLDGRFPQLSLIPSKKGK